MDAEEYVSAYLDGFRALPALEALHDGAPGIAKASRDALNRNSFELLSKAGFATLIAFGGDANPELGNFKEYIRRLLANPINIHDLSIWTLFFALRDASDRLQLDHGRSPTSESHLTGHLLSEIAAACERWRQIVDAPLGRYGSRLVLQKIDLSILGGEQATGGDFGLILDLDGLSTQPDDAGTPRPRGRRIVPFVIQAKRYTRPNADVSQSHPQRGPQRHMLARNDCASAYIFYENGTAKIGLPLPPIVKPVGAVDDTNRTNVLEGGLDLATYLVAHMFDHRSAPGADTPDEALRMIFEKGVPSYMAVVASSEGVAAHYEAEFTQLAKTIRGGSGEEGVLVPA